MEDDRSPTGQKNGRASGGRVLLFVSLALNLLIAGAVVGALLQRADSRPPAADNAGIALRDLGYGAFGRALSKPDRKELSRAIRQSAREFSANRREIRAQTRLMLKALQADPYDPARVRDIAQNLQARLAERQQIAQQLLLGHINQMTPEERKVYVRRLERLLKPERNRQ